VDSRLQEGGPARERLFRRVIPRRSLRRRPRARGRRLRASGTDRRGPGSAPGRRPQPCGSVPRSGTGRPEHLRWLKCPSPGSGSRHGSSVRHRRGNAYRIRMKTYPRIACCLCEQKIPVPAHGATRHGGAVPRPRTVLCARAACSRVRARNFRAARRSGGTPLRGSRPRARRGGKGARAASAPC
jgi:hypothetical protein